MILHRVLRTPGIQAIDAPAQAPAVAARIGQAVDMVDAQTIDQAIADQLENLRVGFLEYHRTFDAQAAQLVDVEEAPPVDVVTRGAPAGQPVILPLEQAVQTAEAVIGRGIIGAERLLQSLAGIGVLQLLGKFGSQQTRSLIGCRLGLQGIEVLRQGS